MRLLVTNLGPSRTRPVLDRLISDLADCLGVDLRVTSFVRPSPGHANGDSIDVAPEFRDPAHAANYAFAHRSDPVLCYRPAALTAMMRMTLTRKDYLHGLTAVVAAENDHFHLQIGRPDDSRDAGLVYAFSFPKDMSNRYPDSLERLNARFA